ncbi:MAG: metallophosphoesterase [Erysipelotrichaceae bacterium]|nr:metallophosphoesterase [Erysipelotrichaceae bacterium]
MKKKIVLIILILLISLSCLSLYASKYFLQCSYYTITNDKIEHPFRIVLLADLHNSEFGKNNERLVNKVLEQEPDIILIVGDLINQNEQDLSIALTLLSSLSDSGIPVYVSYGNHEDNYEKQFNIDLKDRYELTGAKVLNFEYEDIVINNQKIRLGGLYGYCLAEKYLASGEARKEEVDFLKEFQDTDLYTILLCHMPVTWIINNSLNEWNCDLVLCGHAHGGQIRIPFIGGLYAPDQGYFCGKEKGLYYSDDQTKIMLLTRGLGSTEKIPRINNIPEIVIIDMDPK